VVIDTVGSLDEKFFVWFADWDLCKRAVDAGWSTCYLHPAAAIHYERLSFVNGRDLEDKVRYKVDGWYSAPRQIRDRFVFLRKHASPSRIFGVKMIAVLENTLRLCVMLGNISSREAVPKEGSFQIRACLQTIQTILKA